MKQEIEFLTSQIDHRYPFTLIDVGAMGGIPLKWNVLLDYMQVIAFEPDEREFHNLTSTKDIKYINCALHERPEDLRYHIVKGHGKSSMFEPNMSFLSQFEDVQRFESEQEIIIPAQKVNNLDSVSDENLIKDVDFIKIDTEGSELFILRGGQKKVIPKTFGVQIEVSFVEIRKNQPLFRDVDKFMAWQGFQLMDLRRRFWKRKDYYDYRGKGQLIYGDALYFKKTGVFIEGLSQLRDKAYAKSKFIKSILICLIYKMFDYAIFIVKSGREHGYLLDSEHEKIVLLIKEFSKHANFPRFTLSYRIFNILNYFLQKFKPRPLPLWGYGDNQIGNIEDV